MPEHPTTSNVFSVISSQLDLRALDNAQFLHPEQQRIIGHETFVIGLTFLAANPLVHPHLRKQASYSLEAVSTGQVEIQCTPSPAHSVRQFPSDATFAFHLVPPIHGSPQPREDVPALTVNNSSKNALVALNLEYLVDANLRPLDTLVTTVFMASGIADFLHDIPIRFLPYIINGQYAAVSQYLIDEVVKRQQYHGQPQPELEKYRAILNQYRKGLAHHNRSIPSHIIDYSRPPLYLGQSVF